MKKEQFYIDGMTCSACSSGIERSLSRKGLVSNIEVNLISKIATVEYDEKHSNLEQIFAFIEKLGYTPHKNPQTQDNLSLKTIIATKKWGQILQMPIPTQLKLTLSILSSIIVLTLSMVGMFISLPSFLQNYAVNATLQIILTLLVMLINKEFYTKGFQSLFMRSPNMDSLIALSTTAAFLYSLYLLTIHAHGFYFESIVVILTLVSIGKAIEEKAKHNANDNITALLNTLNKEAIIIKDGKECKVPLSSVKVGDSVRILPGNSLGVDGILQEGEGFLDESMLSGEVLPIYKKVGDKLFAGSLNTTTSFILKATTTSHTSTLQNMVTLLQKAANFKTKMTRIADRVAAIFVPCVIIIALIAGGIWSVLENINFGFEIFISVLVISCPCALGLATPMAIMIGSSLASKRGMFFRNAEAMETIKDVSSIVFDKTGTLTDAKLTIKQIIAIPPHTKEEVLQIAASIEQGSEHLVAQSILNEAKKQHLSLLGAKDFTNIAGYGISATINDTMYQAGSKDLFQVDFPPLQESGIIVGIGSKKKLMGIILLQDTIKQGAKETLEALESCNIQPYIVSGDNLNNVKQVAEELKIQNFLAHAKPEDKLKFIETLKKQRQIVMMVGDGINDAAALSASDVSCSFSQASDVSRQSATIIICNDNLKNIYYAIKLGGAIVRNIKENLFWAFCYNVIAIPIACGVLYGYGILLNPMIAALAMSLSSLSVVANAQRLRSFNPKI